MIRDGGKGIDIKSLAGIFILAGFLAAAGVLLPFVGVFPALFLPLPMLILRLENREPLPALILSGLVLGIPLIFTGRISSDLIFYGGMLLYGFAMGEGWRRGLSKEAFVLRALLAVLGAGCAAILFLAISKGTGPLTLVGNHVAANLAMTLEIYRQMEMPKETLTLFEAAIPRLEYALTRLLPAIAAFILIFAAWLNLLAARPMVRSRNIQAADLGLFINWGVPPVFIWGIIVAALVLMVPFPFVRILGISCLLVLLPLYFLQGMAIVAYWFHHRAVPPIIRYALYALMLIQQVLFLVILLIGIFDTWLNFRKRIGTKPQS
ncbi:uncharacterized protein YybS (DUF2232 family) [Desulfobotulus alkaliphilus]|uniref:Uncharacterized protein YybS (DUF2232 family) n=1 Tax=Desulfobotulus alkaliphilus TaxID=622671 RepID=A0A562S7H4_9BACT|nr:DUF2232 domain-containing protein [Desulfobotulus alkaliphilus]TWI77381.1 uncharacterized protein YybS (DUF2232 family) [Desulfobotulus alkaliphilus]